MPEIHIDLTLLCAMTLLTFSAICAITVISACALSSMISRNEEQQQNERIQ